MDPRSPPPPPPLRPPSRRRRAGSLVGAFVMLAAAVLTVSAILMMGADEDGVYRSADRLIMATYGLIAFGVGAVLAFRD